MWHSYINVQGFIEIYITTIKKKKKMLPFDANKKQSKQKHGRYSEFQAIVLAGYGHRLYPLSEDNNLPKALLPLANKPMLYYVLDWTYWSLLKQMVNTKLVIILKMIMKGS
ncbi:hypothetical protein C2G38_2140238 [Gigaspora rosea]|uniref:Translation initiation factor eIF2B subunit gamma n=1 Tax=Gigaspora rosea TaxID=44941 RepID=A0A397VIN9_9GLOM|nr:hypothetical protein C2G38_2140238 [Gigaspora rosea]